MYITVIIAIKRWINNWLLPELTVHRGQTYYFKVFTWNLIVTWNVIRIDHYDSSLRSKAATTKSLEVWTIILFTSPVAEMGDMVFFKDLSLWAWYLMIIMIRIDYASWDEMLFSLTLSCPFCILYHYYQQGRNQSQNGRTKWYGLGLRSHSSKQNMMDIVHLYYRMD